MSPAGPVLEPPPAPDSSFPPKVKQKEERTPVAEPPAAPVPLETSTRKLVPSRDTASYERPPEAPRRLQRDGTQSVSNYPDRSANNQTLPMDKSVAISGMKETPTGTRPLPRVDTPTTAKVKADSLPQSPSTTPLPQPQPVYNPAPTPAPPVERPARPQTQRLATPAQRQPTLDSVMPHPVQARESKGLLVQADFGARLGAFVLDFMFTLIAVDVVMYLLSAYGGRQSLNWSITAVVLISVLILLFNLILLPSFSGQTIGKKLLGIRIVHEDGSLLTFTGAIKRHLIGYLASALPLMFGFLSAMWSPHGRGWHDKIARTIVVKIV